MALYVSASLMGYTPSSANTRWERGFVERRKLLGRSWSALSSLNLKKKDTTRVDGGYISQGDMERKSGGDRRTREASEAEEATEEDIVEGVEDTGRCEPSVTRSTHSTCFEKQAW